MSKSSVSSTNHQIKKISKIFHNNFPDSYLSKSFKYGSLKSFITILEESYVSFAMVKACKKMTTEEEAIKYFCGICWNKIYNRDTKPTTIKKPKNKIISIDTKTIHKILEYGYPQDYDASIAIAIVIIVLHLEGMHNPEYQISYSTIAETLKLPEEKISQIANYLNQMNILTVN